VLIVSSSGSECSSSHFIANAPRDIVFMARSVAHGSAAAAQRALPAGAAKIIAPP
jgi:hypothetical protein